MGNVVGIEEEGRGNVDESTKSSMINFNTN